LSWSLPVAGCRKSNKVQAIQNANAIDAMAACLVASTSVYFLSWSLLLDASRITKFKHFKMETQSMQWRLALQQAHRFLEQVNPEVQLQYQLALSCYVSIQVLVSC
jgi:hypothetical protein